jgi:branched-chain amino acid transport system substrate-binding protein
VKVRKLLIPLAIAAVLLAACGSDKKPAASANSSSAAKTPTGDPIILGVIVDTSSPAAAVSADELSGMTAAVKELNDNGGVLTRPVQIITENNNGEASQTPAAAEKLIGKGAAALLISTNSADATQIKPTAEKAKVVVMSAVQQGPALTQDPNGTYLFTASNVVGDAALSFSGGMKTAGVKTIGVIIDDSASVQTNWVNYEKQFKADGFNIVDTETIPAAAPDVTSQISRIKDAKPDLLWIQAQNPATAALVHNGAKQIIPNIARIDAGPTGGSAATWKLMDPGALDGVVFLSTIDPSNTRLVKLAKQLGQTPEAAVNYAVLSYDGVKVLAQAIEKAGSTNGDAVKAVGADKLCGFVLRVFKQNAPGGIWPNAKPDCSTAAGNPRKA